MTSPLQPADAERVLNLLATALASVGNARMALAAVQTLWPEFGPELRFLASVAGGLSGTLQLGTGVEHTPDGVCWACRNTGRVTELLPGGRITLGACPECNVRDLSMYRGQRRAAHV